MPARRPAPRGPTGGSHSARRPAHAGTPGILGRRRGRAAHRAAASRPSAAGGRPSQRDVGDADDPGDAVHHHEDVAAVERLPERPPPAASTASGSESAAAAATSTESLSSGGSTASVAVQRHFGDGSRAHAERRPWRRGGRRGSSTVRRSPPPAAAAARWCPPAGTPRAGRSTAHGQPGERFPARPRRGSRRGTPTPGRPGRPATRRARRPTPDPGPESRMRARVVLVRPAGGRPRPPTHFFTPRTLPTRLLIAPAGHLALPFHRPPGRSPSDSAPDPPGVGHPAGPVAEVDGHPAVAVERHREHPSAPDGAPASVGTSSHRTPSARSASNGADLARLVDVVGERAHRAARAGRPA